MEHLKFLNVVAFVATIRTSGSSMYIDAYAAFQSRIRFLPELLRRAEYRYIGYFLADRKGTKTISACAMETGSKSGRNIPVRRSSLEFQQMYQTCFSHFRMLDRLKVYQEYLTCWTDRKTAGYMKNDCAPSCLVSENPGLAISHYDRRSHKKTSAAGRNRSAYNFKKQDAVRLGRKNLLRTLSHGKTGARNKIIKNLLFVLARM